MTMVNITKGSWCVHIPPITLDQQEFGYKQILDRLAENAVCEDCTNTEDDEFEDAPILEQGLLYLRNNV